MIQLFKSIQSHLAKNNIFKYKHLITKLLSFTKQLGNGLMTLNTLSQEPDIPENRASIYINKIFERQ